MDPTGAIDAVVESGILGALLVGAVAALAWLVRFLLVKFLDELRASTAALSSNSESNREMVKVIERQTELLDRYIRGQ